MIKGLERIENVEKENFELKKKIVLEMVKSEDLKKTYERLSNQLDILNEDLEIIDSEQITQEKNRLFETVNAISDELEFITNQNIHLEKECKDQEKMNLIEEIEKIKQENQILNQVIKFSKKREIVDISENQTFSRSLNNPKITKSDDQILKRFSNTVNYTFFEPTSMWQDEENLI